ncbi:unknown [Rickettsia prowazekii str. Madrid E]|uniref:Uncharacterized protein RP352 n=1 Tax=Rickettsia prowazekii (strain Madrid E) TaxID=272947 RepID=Y352_RICPR|nr:RecName: Full=Uncharacterized protein RP352 [Rickettsia prowazekii str. Madrid E]EOB10469.1 hypothetical protein H377_4430 [Rickettsia prowazekii str. Cairo 3]CAA14812.1 unknown [Rickettsia prowazekii str. Madrid E]
MILLKVNHKPFMLPCVVIASLAYSEQVGWNRQLLPSSGEIKYL